jgi:hypothetical protein
MLSALTKVNKAVLPERMGREGERDRRLKKWNLECINIYSKAAFRKNEKKKKTLKDNL